MAGRKSKYNKQVKPYLDQIDKWLNNGATEKQVATALNIAYSSWSNYKNQFEDLKKICDKPRVGLVLNLRGALVNRALGMTVEEKKTYIKESEKTGKTKYTEITVKEIPPDTTAIFGALKMYDPDKLDYDIQAQNVEIKKEHLELQKKLAEEKMF